MKSTDPAEVRNSGISDTARVAASNMENRNTLSSMFFRSNAVQGNEFMVMQCTHFAWAALQVSFSNDHNPSEIIRMNYRAEKIPVHK